MTALPAALGTRSIVADASARPTRFGPMEGWSSLLLLALMCAIVGWAIDDARWVLGPQTRTDFLPWVGALGMAWGATAGILRRGRIVAHLGGAIIATFVLSIVVGAQLRPGGSPAQLFQATSDSVVGAYLDLVVRRHLTTTEVGHFLMVLGGLVWGTGQFAGYAAYGHRRPLAAVLVPGSILLGNVALTRLDQFLGLVVFTLSALFFLLRFHIADEERAWRRHRVADVGDAVGIYARAGFAFIAVAVIGSLVLTQSASSAPLAGAWSGVSQQLIDIGNTLARYFPAGGPGTRFSGVAFGPTVTITGAWVTDDTPVLTIQTRREFTPGKWRVAAYDRMSASGWSLSSSTQTNVPAGVSPLDGTSDEPESDVAYLQETYFVTGPGGAPGVLVAPGIPVAVDRATRPRLVQHGSEAYWAGIETQSGGQYKATADLPDLSNATAPGALTANRLRAAGTTYPPDLLALYTDVQPESVGPQTRALAAKIVADARASNPYDIARAMESYLRDGSNFTYDQDVTDIDCQGAGVVECFVVSRHGYCEHYASTMAMMLRLEGIPARLVEGFLPGDRDQNGVEIIKRNRAHAWVQVWFPGSGWVDFDPTGGGVGSPTVLPAGPAASAVATPSAGPSLGPLGSGDNERDPTRNTSRGGAGGGAPDSRVILFLGFMVFLVVAFVVGVVAYRRLGRPATPETVYGTVASIAARLGHRRRPTQTVYEYLGTLSDAVPAVRPELQLVGHSAVEAVYGRKVPAPSRLAALGAARRRLRIALLRLAFVRRPRDRRRP